MFWITRKATGKVVGRSVPEESLDLYLRTLPSGVYGVEDSDGNELNEVLVRSGRVEYKHCNGSVPEATILPNGSVVTVGTGG
jgi:hypothetical protein